MHLREESGADLTDKLGDITVLLAYIQQRQAQQLYMNFFSPAGGSTLAPSSPNKLLIEAKGKKSPISDDDKEQQLFLRRGTPFLGPD